VDLLVLCRGVSLRSEISRCRAGAGEEPSEDWLDDGSEDNLGAIGHWKSHPQDEDELEDIVEWEPVDSVDQAFKDIQEGVNNPVCQPLSVVDLVRTEKSVQGIVAGKDKTGEVNEEFTSDVEEHQEEVEAGQAEYCVDLGDAGLPLKVIQYLVLRQLLVELRDLVLCLILKRHLKRCDRCVYGLDGVWGC